MQAGRRSFLRTAGGAAGFMILPRRLIAASGETPPSETVCAVGIGVGGQGRRNLQGFANVGKVIAFADLDARAAGAAKKENPGAKVFDDYRKMYDELGKDTDAVIIATPDHWHALPALEAMQRGKHVYLEKPLARTVWEVRKLLEGAARYKVVTQMGNQGRSFESNSVFASWVQRGVLGRITEVHAWVTQGMFNSQNHLPDLAKEYPVPKELDWERWVGPSPFHPYNPKFAPGAWRAWTPFGTGQPGDMACHVLDPIFTALRLPPPTTIQAEVTPSWDKQKHALAYPNDSRITFGFELVNRKPLSILWHHGNFCKDVPRPPELEEGRTLGNEEGGDLGGRAGAIVYGTANTLTYGSHGAEACRVIPEEKMKGLVQTKALGGYRNLGVGDHHRDFVNAIKTGRTAGSDFHVVGAEVETALLGSIAIRNPGIKLEWDAQAMRITNCPEADAMVTPEYRQGYELKV